MAQADMFLRLKGKATGSIKGESNVAEHPEEIEISQWGWGMTGSSALAGGGASAKSALSEISFCKRTDRSTTQLMSVMRNNEVVEEAELSVRKAGTNPPVDYLKVKVKNGRINSFTIGNAAPGSPEMIERFSIVFAEIEVTYAAQSETGAKGADMLFSAEVGV